MVRLASGGDRLTFLGDAVFPDHFDRPDWYNAFDHDPEEAVRVRVRLLRELAATREPLVAAHLSFPSVGRVAVAGDVFRWVPAYGSSRRRPFGTQVRYGLIRQQLESGCGGGGAGHSLKRSARV